MLTSCIRGGFEFQRTEHVDDFQQRLAETPMIGAMLKLPGLGLSVEDDGRSCCREVPAGAVADALVDTCFERGGNGCDASRAWVGGCHPLNQGSGDERGCCGVVGVVLEHGIHVPSRMFKR